MESIRIGNDISVQWAITHNGTPGSLEGRKLNLQLSCMYGKYDITDYTIVGNTIRFTFYGKDQKSCGNYTLTLFENKGEKGMMVVDACDVFKLVPKSCMESEVGENSNLSVSHANIETVVHHLNNPSNTIVSDTVNRIEVMTQEEYDGIQPDDNTLYVIV